ncbi:PREDICTED: probable inactive histone-lysine N-methyltransferase SUVR2 [Nicotiana attenuata]|uniref:Inactive histone-lysine n-methyltransferase suvr2 n=1 Tax=Nicotiana attenuata TaxID=49451 RepID=A0A314L625_NICAT|nr:PREDICTED: probable inactive histone-lysine N-methyltransferase SUVR2 [Nicotiana attenuata]OIT37076.1 putative inactive histone-lysine n-methyltransferase suvr2 [Nicotiana attenuata]
MPPNSRVDCAFRAMKAIGISGDKVKPVLKKLLKLYNKNWDLIEEENYRVLADAIFENEESKETENKKSSENPEQEELVQDEPEPPLKRQRLKNQLSQPYDSPESHVQNQPLGVLDSSQSMGDESQAGSCPSFGRNKGKQPISSNSLVPQGGSPLSQPSSIDKSLPVSRRAGSISGNGIPVSPTMKSNANHAFIKPKDEPITDDLPHFEVPLAVIRPGSASKGETLPNVVDSDTNDGIPLCQGVPNGKPETSTVKSPTGLEIASSLSGEVKIILKCGPVLGRSDFYMPTLDEVVKLMEDKYLKQYKELDPNFSVMKVMADVCQCFWEMGTESPNK